VGNQKQISKAEYDKLLEARELAQNSGLMDIEQPDTDSATLAAIGGCYQIGNIAVPQMGLDTVALLAIAGVQLDGESESKSDADAMREIAVALYIICNGSEACTMLMGVKQRLKALERLEGLAKKSPDMFQRYMDKIDAIGGDAFAELDARAFEFLGAIEGATIQDITDVITQMAEDFTVVMGLLPESNDSGKKK